MSQNIDLASFTFDETKLIESITKTKQVFFALKTQQLDNNKVITDYSKQINTLIKDQDLLQQSGQGNSEQFLKNDVALQILTKSQEVVIKANTELTLKLSDVTNELKQQDTALKGTATTASGTATPYKNLNEEMNRMKQEAKDLGAELIILEREGKKNTDEYANIEAQFKKSSSEANALNDEFKKLDESVGDNQRSVGDYGGAIKTAFGEVTGLNGAMNQLQGVFDSVSALAKPFVNDIKATAVSMKESATQTEGMSLAQKSLSIATGVGTGALRIFTVALAATGIGLIILAIGLLANGLSKLDPVMDLIKQATAGFGGAITKVSNMIVNFVSGITSIGDAFSKIGDLILSPRESIKKFTSEVAKAAQSAAQLKAAEQGLGDLKEIYAVREKNIQTEIALDRIRLKNKNLTAEQIKEIENRIEGNFTKSANMRSDVNKETSKQALELAKQTSLGLNSEELKRLENSIRIGDLQVANELLNGERIVSGKRQVTNTLSKDGYKAIQDAISLQQDGNNKALEDKERAEDKIQKANEAADERAKKRYEDQKTARQKAKDDEIKILQEELSFYVSNESSKKKTTLEQIDFILETSKKRLAILDKELLYGKISQTKYNEELQKINQDSAKQQSERFIAKAKSELDLFISQNQSKLENVKNLNQGLIDLENQRLEKIKSQNLILLAEDKKTNQALIDDKISKGVELTNSDREYLTQKNNLENDFRKQNKLNQDSLDKQISDERLLKQAQDFQLKILEVQANGTTELEIKSLQLDQETALELQKLFERQDLTFQQSVNQRLEQDALLTEEQAIKDQLNAELLLAKDENEKIRIQNQLNAITIIEQTKASKTKTIDNEVLNTKLQAYSKIFGDIGAFFGKETAAAKVAGIAQAGINTYLGATQALADPKLVAAYPLNIISAGTIIASGLQSVAKIAGFDEGGLILDGQRISRRNGDDVLITARRGEVILNENQQAMLGGPDVFSKIGVPGFISGGVVGSSLSNVQNNITQSLNLNGLSETISKAVYDGAQKGTFNGSQQGISDLSTNNAIAEGANF